MTSYFVHNVIRDLIGLIHKCYIDLRKFKWSVQVNSLLNNCKQNMTSLSLLAGRTVLLLLLLLLFLLLIIIPITIQNTHCLVKR